jgi:hypothetical protein
LRSSILSPLATESASVGDATPTPTFCEKQKSGIRNIDTRLSFLNVLITEVLKKQ